MCIVYFLSRQTQLDSYLIRWKRTRYDVMLINNLIVTILFIEEKNKYAQIWHFVLTWHMQIDPNGTLDFFFLLITKCQLILNVCDEKSLRRILKSKSCLIINSRIIEQLPFIKWCLKVVSNNRFHILNFIIPNTSTVFFTSY